MPKPDDLEPEENAEETEGTQSDGLEANPDKTPDEDVEEPAQEQSEGATQEVSDENPEESEEAEENPEAGNNVVKENEGDSQS